jgi:dienelactone hydrolase
MEAGKQLHVFYYKEAHRFFFNPEHEHYHRENTQRAWNQVLKQFRSTM